MSEVIDHISALLIKLKDEQKRTMITFGKLLRNEDQDVRLIGLQGIMDDLGDLIKYKRKPFILEAIQTVTEVRPFEGDFVKYRHEIKPAKRRQQKSLQKLHARLRENQVGNIDVEALNHNAVAVVNHNLADISVVYEQATCVICRQNAPRWVAFPCRHILLCDACYQDDATRPTGACPVCRQNLVGWFVAEN